MRTDTLYVSDLDGTLLSTDSQISDASVQIINDLTQQGALITVATARTPATVVHLLSKLTTTTPAVVMTGCAYWLRDKECLSEPHFIPGNDMHRALDFCHNYGVFPFVFVLSDDGKTLDVYHAGETLNDAENKFYQERKNLSFKRFNLNTAPSDRANDFTMLMYAMGSKESICHVADEFRKVTNCSVCAYPDVFNPSVWNFEVFPPGITKAGAVSRLKDRLNVKRLVVFGDSLNDLPMMKVADLAVAVENALPEVKAEADIVIGPNYSDAVARFIADDL